MESIVRKERKKLHGIPTIEDWTGLEYYWPVPCHSTSSTGIPAMHSQLRKLYRKMWRPAHDDGLDWSWNNAVFWPTLSNLWWCEFAIERLAKYFTFLNLTRKETKARLSLTLVAILSSPVQSHSKYNELWELNEFRYGSTRPKERNYIPILIHHFTGKERQWSSTIIHWLVS